MFIAKIKFQTNKNYKNIEIWDSSASLKTCTTHEYNTQYIFFQIYFFYFTHFQALGPNCIRRRFKFKKEIYSPLKHTLNINIQKIFKNIYYVLLNEVCLVGYKKAWSISFYTVKMTTPLNPFLTLLVCIKPAKLVNLIKKCFFTLPYREKKYKVN